MVAFAEVGDLVARWRPLTPEESALAEVLIEDASQMILDERPLTEVEQVEQSATLKRVVVAVVKRAMLAGDDMAGVTQMSSTTGPFSEQRTFANPTGDLFLTKAERRALGIGQKAFTVDPLGDDYVAPWRRVWL